MFTGIVEELGKIKTFEKDANGATLEIECSKVLSGTNIGDSICVNGVCETVTEINHNSIIVRVSDETLSVTNFKDLKIGDIVNLERALTLNSRLGGHIVSGHIDCTGMLSSIERLSDFYNVEIKIPSEYAKYVVYKGSVTVNGISLTVANIKNNIFKIAIIPHTFENTNLKLLKVGDYVNIETDILARYIEKLLLSTDNKKESKISVSFLQENGFM